MNPVFSRDASSYRDPSGNVFRYNGQFFRQINKVYQKDFEHFISSGFYQHLVDKNLLIKHTLIDQNLTGDEDCFVTIKPEELKFISYPYEWSFDMLKDAAILTLQLAIEALRFGMILKDATPFNVQLHKGQMIFIDTLSFEILDETKPWIAYRQFCETFLAPLALMHYLRMPLQPLLLAYPEGIPLNVAHQMLPWTSKFNIGTYLHLHLNAGYSKKGNLSETKVASFSKQKLNNIFKSLLQTISGYRLEYKAVWSNYYEEAYQREDYVANKKAIIEKWLELYKVNSAIDLGANEGLFSELLASKGICTISTDFDHFSINKLYQKIKSKEINQIFPVVLDLTNPSAAIGLNNKERPSFTDRANTDLVVALAVIHHLCIGKNIPFHVLSELFKSFGKKLIVEFVPKEDIKVKEMLLQKKDIYEWYNKENFLKAFSKCYQLIETAEIKSTGRTLYLLQQHEA